MTGGGGKPRGGRMALGGAAPRPVDTKAAAAQLAREELNLASTQEVSPPPADIASHGMTAAQPPMPAPCQTAPDISRNLCSVVRSDMLASSWGWQGMQLPKEKMPDVQQEGWAATLLSHASREATYGGHAVCRKPHVAMLQHPLLHSFSSHAT